MVLSFYVNLSSGESHCSLAQFKRSFIPHWTSSVLSVLISEIFKCRLFKILFLFPLRTRFRGCWAVKSKTISDAFKYTFLGFVQLTRYLLRYLYVFSCYLNCNKKYKRKHDRRFRYLLQSDRPFLTENDESSTGFIRGILRGVRYAKSLRVLFLHRRSPFWTTLVLYSRVVFIFNEPTNWRYWRTSFIHQIETRFDRVLLTFLWHFVMWWCLSYV